MRTNDNATGNITMEAHAAFRIQSGIDLKGLGPSDQAQPDRYDQAQRDIYDQAQRQGLSRHVTHRVTHQ